MTVMGQVLSKYVTQASVKYSTDFFQFFYRRVASMGSQKAPSFLKDLSINNIKIKFLQICTTRAPTAAWTLQANSIHSSDKTVSCETLPFSISGIKLFAARVISITCFLFLTIDVIKFESDGEICTLDGWFDEATTISYLPEPICLLILIVNRHYSLSVIFQNMLENPMVMLKNSPPGRFQDLTMILSPPWISSIDHRYSYADVWRTAMYGPVLSFQFRHEPHNFFRITESKVGIRNFASNSDLRRDYPKFPSRELNKEESAENIVCECEVLTNTRQISACLSER